MASDVGSTGLKCVPFVRKDGSAGNGDLPKGWQDEIRIRQAGTTNVRL